MTKKPILTGPEVKAIRQSLGWTLKDLGLVLGFAPAFAAQSMHRLESESLGSRRMTYQTAHLLLAIKNGYRPVTRKVSERAV